MNRPSISKFVRRVGATILIGSVASWTLGTPTSIRAQDTTPVTDLAYLSGIVSAAGSATLGPTLEAAAGAFAEQAPAVRVLVEATNSGKGLEKFCGGETDLATSGRRIKTEEAVACAAAGVAYDELEVAYDGIAVVASPGSDFLTCLTIDQLKRAWEPGSTVVTWQDLDPAWPDEVIEFHSRGEDSGTYQFFTQAVVGKEGVSREDYAIHDGHSEVADEVAVDDNALGFLPFPYYEANRDRVTLVEVDAGDGCVAPTPETILDGSYGPLSRPMYLYVNRENLGRSEVAEFLRFYIARAAEFAKAGGIVGDPTAQASLLARLEQAIAGTSSPDGPAATADRPNPVKLALFSNQLLLGVPLRGGHSPRTP
jgi:phosphate transport system substrate-binding protein